MEKYLQDYLEKHNIVYKVHNHKAVFTVTESHLDEDIAKIPGLRTKNLFIKDESKQFYLVCMPGEKRLDMKKLKSELKVKEIHFASAEELKSELNLTPGSVSIFGMINAKNVKLIIDKKVWAAEITGFHPNINTQTLEIKKEDLHKFLDSLKVEKIILDL